MTKSDYLLLLAEWYSIPLIPNHPQLTAIPKLIGTLRMEHLQRYVHTWWNGGAVISSDEYSWFILFVMEATQDD